jgi:hypothetical protein
MLVQNKEAILVGLLIMSIAAGCQLGMILPAQAALLGLSFEELSRQAELIILGVVIDEKLAQPGTIGPGLESHTISIEKVFKGKYNASTVDVITESEIMEDSPQFNVDEKAILFLYQKPIFGDKPSGNDYTVVNQLNGKYSVEDNGKVGNISIADFEKKIKDESSPKTNFTQLISNEALSYYYRNDRDTQFNEPLPLTRTPS